MLVLRRKVGEPITLTDREDGKKITITPVRVKSGAVRISIDAPGNFLISRDESTPDLTDEILSAEPSAA